MRAGTPAAASRWRSSDLRRALAGVALVAGQRDAARRRLERIRMRDQQLGARGPGQRYGERDGVGRALGVVHTDDDLGHGRSWVRVVHDSPPHVPPWHRVTPPVVLRGNPQHPWWAFRVGVAGGLPARRPRSPARADTGIDGRARVGNDLAREKIVGTPDSTIPGPIGRQRRRGAGVRERHPQAHARGHRRQDVRGDAALPRRERQGHQQRVGRREGREDRRTGRNGARDLWVTSTALQTALQTGVLRRGRGDVRDRDGGGAAAQRDRVPDPHAAGAAGRTAAERRPARPPVAAAGS